jgi:hypothetical protein
MGFWIGILFGALFVYVGVKIGFYETWILLFNLVVSIYLAVFLRPVIEQFIPIAGDTSYGDALIMLAVAIGVFVLLYGISYVFFSSQFNVPVPRIFDVVGSGFLGFWAGLLVWSFIIVIISVTPIYQSSFLETIGFTEKFKKEFRITNVAYMSWWINKVNNLVSYKSNYLSTEELVDQIYQKAEQRKPKKMPLKVYVPPEPNEPNEPANLTGAKKQITCPDIADQNSLSSEKNAKAGETDIE